VRALSSLVVFRRTPEWETLSCEGSPLGFNPWGGNIKVFPEFPQMGRLFKDFGDAQPFRDFLHYGGKFVSKNSFRGGPNRDCEG